MRTKRKRNNLIQRRSVLIALFACMLGGVGWGACHFNVQKGNSLAAPPGKTSQAHQLAKHTAAPNVTRPSAKAYAPQPAPPQAAQQRAKQSAQQTQTTSLSLYTKTIDVNETQSQHGIKVTVQHVVFLQDVMSVVVEVQNQSNDEAAFHIHDTVATQARQEFAWSPSGQTMLLPSTPPHATATGIVTFQGLNPQKPFALSLDIKVDQDTSQFAPYQFQINPT